MARNTQTIRKSLAASLMAVALVFTAASVSNIAYVPQAEASVFKKVKLGAKYVGKGFAAVEKAGRNAQKKRGIVGKAGGILKNVGSAGKKGSSKVGKSMSKASKGISKAANKNKITKKAGDVHRQAGQWKTKGLNKAFRNCRGKACNLTRDVVEVALP